MNYSYCSYCGYIGIYSKCPYCGSKMTMTETLYNPKEWSKNRQYVINDINKEYNIKANPRFNSDLEQLRISEESIRQRVMQGIIE